MPPKEQGHEGSEGALWLSRGLEEEYLEEEYLEEEYLEEEYLERVRTYRDTETYRRALRNPEEAGGVGRTALQ